MLPTAQMEPMEKVRPINARAAQQPARHALEPMPLTALFARKATRTITGNASQPARKEPTALRAPAWCARTPALNVTLQPSARSASHRTSSWTISARLIAETGTSINQESALNATLLAKDAREAALRIALPAQKAT